MDILWREFNLSMKYLILTSPTTSKYISQSSIFYLITFLSGNDIEIDVVDLSGTIDFYDPPSEMFEDQKSLWQSELIFDESWIDNYIPECTENYDRIYASALFSTDIILQGRYVKRCKKVNPTTIAVIGGPAVKNLNPHQQKAVSSVFDEVFSGSLPIEPKYNSGLYKLKDFVTIVTGTGCDWGKCRFCNSGKEKYSLKSLDEVVIDFLCVSELSDSDIMLSSDSMPITEINELSLRLIGVKNKRTYNFMMRAREGVTKAFSKDLQESGCSDVFVGGEILDDLGLRVIGKGTTVRRIRNTLMNLSGAGINVQLGLILFLPRVSKKQLENQLRNLEDLLPYVSQVELESLSVPYNSEFDRNGAIYGIKLYPDKNLVSPAWCYGLSPDVPWGFWNNSDYYLWEKHIDSLRQMLDGYVDEKYWWHVDYIKENWK